MKLISTLFTLVLIGAFSVSVQGQNFRKLEREADTLYQKHDYFNAIEIYLQALEKRTKDIEVLGKLANSYRLTNQMEQASSAYTRALDTRKPDPQLYLEYGHVLKTLGQYEEAKKQYLEYAKVDPTVGNHFAETCNFAIYQRGQDNGILLGNLDINTQADAYGPTFHQQGLVFSSTRYNRLRPTPSSTEINSFQQPNELYLAVRGPDGNLLQPNPLLQNPGWEGANIGPVAFSSDGSQVAYTRNNFVEGVRHISEAGMETQLFLGAITPDGNWAGEQIFPYNGPSYSNGFPSFSPEGDAVYFASDLGTGFGGYDIYVSFRQGEGWSPPQNLGPVINTPGDEITPYFDGTQLFFASDWHPGLGGYDIFRAELSGERWAQVFHIGFPISSPYDDFGPIYHVFSNTGFITSNRTGGKGGLDIYRLARPAETIVIQVQHGADGSPIEGAVIDFSNCGEGLRQTNAQGIFQFPSADEMNCQIVVRKDEFVDEIVALKSTGQPGSQQILVSLNRRDEEYIGQVTDYENGLPLPTASVSAVNQSNGQVTSVNTDRNGNYRLGLAPNAVYLVNYSAPGYREASRTIPVHPGDDPGLLGSVTLLSAAKPLPAGIASPEQALQQSSPPPAQVPPGPVNSGPVLPAGYAIQLAALSQPAIDRFADLNQYGKVYSIPEGGKHKIRVGVYTDRAKAGTALASVKASGHPNAFIVSEAGGIAPEAATGGAPVSGFAAKGVAAGGAPGDFRIQVGAFRQAYNVKDWSIADYGTILDQKRGDLTVKYLTGYANKAEAQAALAKVHSAGFPDAYIVENKGGTWTKVN